MIELADFLSKYRIDQAAFKATGLKWSELVEIAADHTQRERLLQPIASYFRDVLQQLESVHSLKARIKDPEHLIAKIIRKRITEPKRAITLSNYRQEVTDLIGVRAMHLFKDEWLPIHVAITNSWRSKEKPVANIRRGDPDKLFRDAGLKVREHAAGYRSVHYVVRYAPAKRVEYVEIQVRTIFEEGWSEIDHRLRYAHALEHPLLSDFLTLFNGLAGSADHMGSYIQLLANEIDAVKRAGEEREVEQAKFKTEIETLKRALAKVDMTAPVKREIAESLEIVESAASSSVRAGSDSAFARAMEQAHLNYAASMLRRTIDQARLRLEPSEIMKKAMADTIGSASGYAVIMNKALEEVIPSSLRAPDTMLKATEEVIGRAAVTLPPHAKARKE